MDQIRETYDRYDYLPQKREAFDKLAAWVERIVNPPPADNVVALGGRRSGRHKQPPTTKLAQHRSSRRPLGRERPQ